MEVSTEKSPVKRNGYVKNNVPKEIKTVCLNWADNITAIDISNQNITYFDDNMSLPPKLETLNLSRNNMQTIPDILLDHRHLKELDISFNNIEFFDDTPEFCNTIERLNLANNSLRGPPCWVWSEAPANLHYLNLSNNFRITESFKNGYYEELLTYATQVRHIAISNCKLGLFVNLLSTFPKAEFIEAGTTKSSFASNFIENVPGKGLEKCCDIERLCLSNTKLYNVMPNIDIYKKLREIDLSMNNIRDLPREFCNLEKLEICVLSDNNLLYLPESFDKLVELKFLYLAHNELCMLPDELKSLPKLQLLDLYNNNLYEIHNELWEIPALDVAQNYFDEPEDKKYLDSKIELRSHREFSDRTDGRKHEIIRSESEHSPDTSDDDLLDTVHSDDEDTKSKLAPSTSDEEDWDSAEYWEPHPIRRSGPAPSPWLHFIHQKMAEGNFCPMDLHTVPVIEQVRYEQMCNPKVKYFVEGQFDDITDDDS
ncbi:malignant fibrous histiocytoma-amplified sequence 1 homolog [Plutella xylostella]|uniref:malignant fibrous histiocytoma-amplified sequence 1 homolog n=1 Tax=Plutella xylostella TaxID=51655 RepID=UPI002032C659|nr:malignant fibrous histiocytoma-amplified sequence 1 homolog [Plutella xylostella]